MFGILADSTGIRFNPLADKYVNLLLDNADTGYAEVLASLFVSMRFSHTDTINRSAPISRKIYIVLPETSGNLHTRQQRHSFMRANMKKILLEYGPH